MTRTVATGLGLRAGDVIGVKLALRELRQIDPTLRKQLQAEMRQAAAPMKASLTAGIPKAAPLSGLGRWWGNPHRYSVRTGGRARRGGSIPLLRVQVRSRGVSLADMAATGRSSQGAALVANLGGGPSRYVWPAAERALPRVNSQARQVADKIMRSVNRRLASRAA